MSARKDIVELMDILHVRDNEFTSKNLLQFVHDLGYKSCSEDLCVTALENQSRKVHKGRRESEEIPMKSGRVTMGSLVNVFHSLEHMQTHKMAQVDLNRPDEVVLAPFDMNLLNHNVRDVLDISKNIQTIQDEAEQLAQSVRESILAKRSQQGQSTMLLNLKPPEPKRPNIRKRLARKSTLYANLAGCIDTYGQDVFSDIELGLLEVMCPEDKTPVDVVKNENNEEPVVTMEELNVHSAKLHDEISTTSGNIIHGSSIPQKYDESGELYTFLIGGKRKLVKTAVSRPASNDVQIHAEIKPNPVDIVRPKPHTKQPTTTTSQRSNRLNFHTPASSNPDMPNMSHMLSMGVSLSTLGVLDDDSTKSRLDDTFL